MQLADAGRQLAQAIIGQYQDLDGRDKKITNVFCLDSDGALLVPALLVPLRNGPYIKCYQQSNQLTLITESKPIIVELRRIPKSFF